MNFLVAAQCIGHSGSISCERRRIENDRVELRNDFFMRPDGGLRFKPVKNIGSFKRAFRRKPIVGGIAAGGGNRLRALIQGMNMGRSRPRGVQSETTQKTEAIEHLPEIYQFSNPLIIDLLI